MDFSWALSALKAGLKVTRSHWKTGFLWCKPAARVQPDWCHDPVLKQLAEQQEGGISASSTISACFKDFNDAWTVTTGWVPQQFDLFADDWKIYFGEGHEKQTPEEIEAYKKLMLDRMPGGSFSQQMLELGTLKAQQQEDDIGKLPKVGSMENCEKLSKAINQLLESIGVMPHLTVTLVPGPEDKELTIAIREKSESGEANYPIHVNGDMQIIHHETVACHVINPDGITKTTIGGYTFSVLDDKVEG